MKLVTWHLSRGISITGKESIALVVNINNNHWVNVFIYPTLKLIHGVNGFRKSRAISTGVLPFVVAWLQAEYDLNGVDFDEANWTYVDIQNSTLQRTGTECGPIALANLECWADDVPLDAEEADMRNWRKRQALCFSYGRVLRSDPVNAPLPAVAPLPARRLPNSRHTRRSGSAPQTQGMNIDLTNDVNN